MTGDLNGSIGFVGPTATVPLTKVSPSTCRNINELSYKIFHSDALTPLFKLTVESDCSGHIVKYDGDLRSFDHIVIEES